MKFKSGTRRLLIYGDSNTWGSDAEGMRYPTESQWPIVLGRLLGADYEIVPEGLCGRIAGDHDEKDQHRNGHTGFEVAMRSASPFDYLIIALGTNDLKDKYTLTTADIVDDLLWYKDRAENYNDSDADMEGRFKKVFYLGVANFKTNEHRDNSSAHNLREELIQTTQTTIELMDLEHSADGLHYSIADHEKVAQRVFDTIKEYEDEV